MNENAVFKLSYGVFFLGTESNQIKNVCVVNTVAQVTQEPLKVCVTVLKQNYTCELISDSKKFSVGIMGVNTPLDTITHYGSVSGRDTDKLAGMPYSTDKLGNPLVSDGCNATLCCRVCQMIDLDTHMMFIADIVDAEILSEDKPMTYADYRDYRAGIKKQGDAAPPEQGKEVYQCSICHYVYDGDVPFDELPEDYICPICKQGKSAFKKV